MESYLTISQQYDGFYEEKRSRFLSAVIPCTSEEQVSSIMAEIKSKYWDARHNVYAFVLRDGTARFSDDGEPHGTAGKPVFDVLMGSGLQDVLVVVTRYFGGVLLGTGGLVRAYSSAARDAVQKVDIVEMCPCVKYAIACPYSDHQRLERLISDCNGNIESSDFAADITINVSFKLKDADEFLLKLREIFSARLTAQEISKGFSPFLLKK
ncbi:MAG: YigZ family protein [Ruminococcaceae bacterium]|nr:YigZ family protein [Oscillospiraceae bacterium]